MWRNGRRGPLKGAGEINAPCEFESRHLLRPNAIVRGRMKQWFLGMDTNLRAVLLFWGFGALCGIVSGVATLLKKFVRHWG